MNAAVSVACTLSFGSFGEYAYTKTYTHISSLADVSKLASAAFEKYN
ncbi:MAG: hypothetical protein G01um101449_11 [Parcubacteria group bacterium Gr01-1014_49]|nr:MAG: hypothetical protein G01um101449_11 [Parcubacteria group bacterium Gr01-1014_49]